MTLIPTQQVPALDLPLNGGGSTTDLNLGTGADGRFTMVVFYRGLHCPVCRKQLGEINRRLDDLTEAGVGRIVAVSMEDQARSASVSEDWKLDRLSVAHGLTEADAREWGLFISHSIKDGEPEVFSEPGMFILDSDGSLFWSAVATMPFGRPPLDEVIAGLKFAQSDGYPARGNH
ncbi:redoxin domain-containing protein [Ornithinimicrobium sp. Arc0846-15]|nr:redoxin domain-containing protein [Ornithinimicrobium laminariae]